MAADSAGAGNVLPSRKRTAPLKSGGSSITRPHTKAPASITTMVGLSADELPTETLHAGDTIQYTSPAYVAGDKRGNRVAKVLRVSDAAFATYPIRIATGELISRYSLIKRVSDRFGNAFREGYALWRKLRSFKLIAGSIDAPSRANLFSEALPGIIEGAMEQAMRTYRAEDDEARDMDEGVESLADSVDFDAPSPRDDVPSTYNSPCGQEVASEEAADTSIGRDAREGKRLVPWPNDDSVECSVPSRRDDVPSTQNIRCSQDENSHDAAGVSIECVISEDEGKPAASLTNDDSGDTWPILTSATIQPGEAAIEDATEIAVTGNSIVPIPAKRKLLDVSTYVTNSIPTRYEREKIRHQGKKRAGTWHTPRSRKRRHQAKCGITRSGIAVYHANPLKAKRTESILRIPGIQTRLMDLHIRRPVFKDPVVNVPANGTEPWPQGVKCIDSCKMMHVEFPDLGERKTCACIGDCFLDSCQNAASNVFCTPNCCNLKARCSNAPRTRNETLKLFKTMRRGLGVFTTTDLDVGDILCEYAGILSVYPSIVEGQPISAIEQNNGFTLLYNQQADDGMYVYVETLNYGSIGRFINHACDPNAAFVEVQNRSMVKILVKMIKDVKAGAQITVNYGKTAWFKCACDKCWAAKDQNQNQQSE